MNETLTNLIFESCVSPALMPKKLALEYGMFMALLYQNVGVENGKKYMLAIYYDHVALFKAMEQNSENVASSDNLDCEKYCVLLLHTGAFYIQKLLNSYDMLATQEAFREEDKHLDNVVLLWCHAYNFKMIDASRVFDILREFVARFREKDINMILLILRGAYSIRLT